MALITARLNACRSHSSGHSSVKYSLPLPSPPGISVPASDLFRDNLALKQVIQPTSQSFESGFERGVPLCSGLSARPVLAGTLLVTQSQRLAPPGPAAFGYGMGNTQKFCKMNECLLGDVLLLSLILWFYSCLCRDVGCLGSWMDLFSFRFWVFWGVV